MAIPVGWFGNPTPELLSVHIGKPTSPPVSDTEVSARFAYRKGMEADCYTQPLLFHGHASL